MKADIHPTYNTQATVTCACGATYQVGSTLEEIHVELCKACHPFYTGTQKIIDTARRVEKFQTRIGKKTASTRTKKVKKVERAKKRKPKFEVEETKSARVKKATKTA